MMPYILILCSVSILYFKLFISLNLCDSHYQMRTLRLREVKGFLKTWGVRMDKHQGPTAAAKSLWSCPTLRPHRRQPARLLCPWDFPGKSIGVGCCCLLITVLPYSKKNYIQSPGINHNGKNIRKGICVRITESLCYTAEVSITLWINYTSMFSKRDINVMMSFLVGAAWTSSFKRLFS